VSITLLIASGMVLIATWLMVGAWALLCFRVVFGPRSARSCSPTSAAPRFLLGPCSRLHRDAPRTCCSAQTSLAWMSLRRFGRSGRGRCSSRLLAYPARDVFGRPRAPGNMAAFAWEAAQRCGALFGVGAIFLLLARLIFARRAMSLPVFWACVGAARCSGLHPHR
jgi:hypothetical protein